jgi:hypothetical protein
MGTQTGGEFAALLDIHTTDATEHQHLSDQLDAAGFGGGFAFSTDAQLAFDKVHELSVAETDITEFQVGGSQDDQPVTAAGMIDKAVKFRAAAAQHGVTCKVLLQDYRSLDLPPNPNFVDLQQQKDTLADCFRQRNLLQKNLNDVEFILANPVQFEAPATGVNLNSMRDQLAAALNVYAHAASSCVNDFRTCAIVAPAPPVPDLTKLPARKTSGRVTVPNLVGMDMEAAESALAQAGLKFVQGNVAGLSLFASPVTSQQPAADALVQAGTEISVVGSPPHIFTKK